MGRVSKIVFTVAVAALLCAFRASTEARYAGVGNPVPDLVLETLDGRQEDLLGGRSGWILLKFGTTWCPQCGDEVGELNRIAGDLRQRGVRVVEVFLREPPEVVRADVRRMPRSYAGRILLDRNGEAISAFGVRVIPRLVLVDPAGVARADSRFQAARDLLATIDRALAHAGEDG
ncbi:TlpA family protein disulfide reductase [Deferrisoma palaeochoriense]